MAWWLALTIENLGSGTVRSDHYYSVFFRDSRNKETWQIGFSH